MSMTKKDYVQIASVIGAVITAVGSLLSSFGNSNDLTINAESVLEVDRRLRMIEQDVAVVKYIVRSEVTSNTIPTDNDMYNFGSDEGVDLIEELQEAPKPKPERLLSVPNSRSSERKNKRRGSYHKYEQDALRGLKIAPQLPLKNILKK